MNSYEIYEFDERRDIALLQNSESFIEFAAHHLIRIADEAIKTHGQCFIALSGGSTPKKIFELLASPKYRDAIDWKNLLLFWGDERAVGPNHPDSNYKMAMDAGFSKLPLDHSQIFRMKAESDIEKHAQEYETIIKKNLSGQSFDLIMLGMGDDGHTASLFPKTKALSINDRLVVANEVPQKSAWRMTMTYPLINQAKNIAFYVAGESKKQRLCDVLFDTKDQFPASKIGTKEHKALWIVDQAASAELLKKFTPQNHLKKII